MSNNTNTPAEFGYVTAHTAGGGQALHIVARTGTHFNGYARAAVCGTAPAGRWGTGSSAIQWIANMNLTGEYGDTVYSTPAEAAAARPVCRRCAAAAAKTPAATVTPEAAPVEAAAAPAEGVTVIRAEDAAPGNRVTGYSGSDPVTAIAAVAPGDIPGYTLITWSTEGGDTFTANVRNGDPVYTVTAPAEYTRGERALALEALDILEVSPEVTALEDVPAAVLEIVRAAKSAAGVSNLNHGFSAVLDKTVELLRACSYGAPAESLDPADIRATELAVMSAPGAVRVDIENGLQASHGGAVATVTAYWTGAPGRENCADSVTVLVTGGDSHPARAAAAHDALDALTAVFPGAVTTGEYQTIARGSRDTIFIFGTWSN